MNTTKKAASNLGRRVCVHPRCRLSSAHGYGEPGGFLIDLRNDGVEPRLIVDYVLAGRARWVQLQPSLDSEAWDIICDADHNGTWEAVDTLDAIGDHWPEVADTLLYCLDKRDMLALARDYYVVLPVILPDASVPNLQSGLSDAVWSNGQAGWIYATKEVVLKRFGCAALDDGARERAEAVLRTEVESRANPQRRRNAMEATA